MRRAVALVIAALALSCVAPAYAARTVAVDAANAVHAFVVGSDGALYHFVGTVSYTFDTNANHSTRFAYSGRVADVCAALS